MSAHNFNRSPLVFAALRDLYRNYENIYVSAEHDGRGYSSLALSRMDDESALEWVKSLLERAVLDGEPIAEVARRLQRSDRFGD